MLSTESAFGRRHARLTSVLAETVEDYSLVSFVPLAIEDRDSVQRVVGLIDKANGYVFSAVAGPQDAPYPPEFVYGMEAADTGAEEMWARYQAEQAGDASQQVMERRGDG